MFMFVLNYYIRGPLLTRICIVGLPWAPPSNEVKTEKGIMQMGGSMQDHCRALIYIAVVVPHQYIILIHEQEGGWTQQ